ncbi:uncharacterized protein LOC141573673 [Camelus bactrianus]|uniref:Uncharacterized protein LOC141573673 n=1 Tax=Camelus bactrianus TaxID=9837 RepID=A0AC58NQJ1_CAMBA
MATPATRPSWVPDSLLSRALGKAAVHQMCAPPMESLGMGLRKVHTSWRPWAQTRAFNPQVGASVCEDACNTRVPRCHTRSGKCPASKASRPVSAHTTFQSGPLDCGGFLSSGSSSLWHSFVWCAQATSGDRLGGGRGRWTSVPVPPALFPTWQGAGDTGEGSWGGGGGVLESRDSRGFPFGRLPAPNRQGRGCGGGERALSVSRRGVGWGSCCCFRGCVTRRGWGEWVKVRPQVCGSGTAARGAAIFGHFGAAGAPPAAREAAALAAPSPPAAGPESPAGRGAEVTDRGRRAPSSPYLVKEAADWPAEQRGGGGRPGRGRGGPGASEGAGRGGGRPPLPPPPTPWPSGVQEARLHLVTAGRESGGWGCTWPQRSGGGGVGGAQLEAWRGWRGGDHPPGRHHPESGLRKQWCREVTSPCKEVWRG